LRFGLETAVSMFATGGFVVGSQVGSAVEDYLLDQ